MIKKLLNIYSLSKNQIIQKYCSDADIIGNKFWFKLPFKESKSKICLVAHIDTVFPHIDGFGNNNVLINNNKIYSDFGLGADDRNGVLISDYIFKTIEIEYQPYVLYTDDEEKGGIGAKEFVNNSNVKNILKNIKFFIEIDRRGRNEAVFYNNEPEIFKAYICSFGFKENIGTFSDVSIIGKETGINCVNVSAGYYNNHFADEYTKINDVEYIIKKIIKILKQK